MSLISPEFLLFAVALVAVYYAVPRRWQWALLLVASLGFYALSDLRHIAFILITAATTYASARAIQYFADTQKAYLKEHKEELSKEDKTAYKATMKAKRKAVLVACLLLNFGLLCAFKYVHFAIEQLNAILGAFGGTPITDTFSLLIPLGISFYTFQTMGYLIDVYWGKSQAERNFLHVVLFTSFFPQVTQGPISAWEDLAGELFREHAPSYHNYSWGAQRMIWGFFKKMVVANILAVYVADVFANYGSYSGLTVLIGAFCYSAQIYADFSGYMDIVCGLCQILDIRLTENFERPYFAKSIAEYWRRWHMSLCSWFKTYIYYPMAMARWNQNLGRWGRKHLGEHVGKAWGNYLPATVALVVVWFVTGLWHGANWAYIAWGGVNGLFIIFSLWMEPTYEKWKKTLHVREESWAWRAFQTLRTFTLVTFIKVLPEVGTLRQGLGLWRAIFANKFLPASLTLAGLFPFTGAMVNLPPTEAFLMALLGVVAMFVVSMLQRKKPLRAYLDAWPLAARVALMALLALIVLSFGVRASCGAVGFLYAQF